MRAPRGEALRRAKYYLLDCSTFRSFTSTAPRHGTIAEATPRRQRVYPCAGMPGRCSWGDIEPRIGLPQLAVGNTSFRLGEQSTTVL